MADRKARMTNRERVDALLRREKPDRVPVWPFAMGFPVVYTQTSIADAYNKPEVALAAQRKAAQDFDWLFIPQIGYAAFGGWEFGGEIKWPSGQFAQAPTVARHPVETEEDVWKLQLPDVKKAGIVPIQYEFCKLASKERLDNEPFNVMGYAGSCFTRAGNICGPDKLAKWILKKPQVAHRLLRLASDFILALADYWKESFGIEGVLPWGAEPTASNQLISAKQFETFAMPYIKEVNEKVLAMGYKHILYHVCGEQNANLPCWAQIPMGDPGLVTIGHEVTLETAAQYFPTHIIMGNLEPAKIQTRTPEQVYEATRQVVEIGKTLPGGFIFAPGCELPPRASPENIHAMMKAVDDFGWYD
jgi:uroporphyrinogen decarboxylase